MRYPAAMLLRFKADRRTLFFVAAYFVCLTLLWVSALAFWPLHVALVMCTSVLAFMGAVATHNALHSPVFQSRAMNRAFQVVLTLTYGHPVSAFVPGHNLSHHRYTQTNRDVMRTTKVRFRYNLLNIMFFILRVAPGIMKADTSYVRAMYKRSPRWFQQYVIESAAFYGATLLLLALDWKKFLFYWFIPHTYAAWGIVTMNYLQHDGADENSEWNHSRNFVGKLVNWWTYNNGYHTLHHMEPGLHWSLLPAEHAKRVAPFIDPRLDQKSLVLYGLKAYVWPGRRETFDGKPVVLPPAEADQPWIPAPSETPSEISLGAALG
jgi:fatty acid desaturase